jgi:predicted dehydrogenase
MIRLKAATHEMQRDPMPENTLKLGIIGGAFDSAVGRSHHIAAQMDGRFRIVAGCFSPNSENNLATAKSLDVPEARTYSDWRKFLEVERDEIDAVLLLTPTPLHAEMAVAALELKVPVISEKALCVSCAEAATIRAARDKNDGFVAVTYNYTGFPMVRELRGMIRDGRLGRLTHVAAEMPQEGFLRLVGIDNSKPLPQAWRLKDHYIPTVSLDLGVHLHHLIWFLTGESPLEVSAMHQSQGHFEGVVDNVQCLARYTGELPVQMWYGKTALGYANGLRIRIFGTEGSAEWVQMNPEFIVLSDNCGNASLANRSANGLKVCNQERYTRFKAGHPAGFIEAFANYYWDIADWLIEHQRGNRNIHDMVARLEIAEEGLQMMECIAASSRERIWKRN